MDVYVAHRPSFGFVLSCLASLLAMVACGTSATSAKGPAETNGSQDVFDINAVGDSVDAFDGVADVADSAGADLEPDLSPATDLAMADTTDAIPGDLSESVDSAAEVSPSYGMALAKELFDKKGIHEVVVTLAPSDWQDYLAGAALPDGEKLYAYYPATIDFDGVTKLTVGVKGFGNGSQTANPAKPNIHIKYDQFLDTGIGPEGQKSFRLKASGQDPTFLREPLAGELIQSIGGYAPRWSWAHVVVNGADYGLYQLQETVDKRLFKNRFANNDGNKYESHGGCNGLNCPVSGCANLGTFYVGDPGDGSEIVALAEAVSAAAPADLLTILQAHIDVPALLADYACDAVLSNLDGLVSSGQNFTLYAQQGSHLLEVIATGQDLTFGNFKDAFYPLASPWGIPNGWCGLQHQDLLFSRVWTGAQTAPLLQAKLRDLQCGPFVQETILSRIKELAQIIHDGVYNDPKGIHTPQQIDVSYAQMQAYVVSRQKTLLDLLGPCP